MVMGVVFLRRLGEYSGGRRNLCNLVSREMRNSLMERKSYVKRSLDMQNNFEQFALAGEETGGNKCTLTSFCFNIS